MNSFIQYMIARRFTRRDAVPRGDFLSLVGKEQHTRCCGNRCGIASSRIVAAQHEEATIRRVLLPKSAR